MMKIFQVDAFTDEPFKGNPACVCLLDREKKDFWMQNFAMEMNLSETAFLLKIKEGYSLRWFTPQTEVPLCGHATLASAHILWQENFLNENQDAVFLTKSGELICKKTGEWINMIFPSRLVRAADAPSKLLNALDLKKDDIIANRYDNYSEHLYLIEVASDKIVWSIIPDFDELKREDANAVIVTSKSCSRTFDFVSRFFAPSLGINEDPVTGSAHCYLTPYWSQKLNKNELTAYQASKRGGVIKCELQGDKVIIKGAAITIFKGELSDL